MKLLSNLGLFMNKKTYIGRLPLNIDFVTGFLMTNPQLENLKYVLVFREMTTSF